ncbi:HPr family phosphocarrier protein [Blastopirellula marina]|uniref:HPr family phosphocarrier protein n=2 Tax=Blastopirellula marina TaxID=124 RepID=A0A2S8GR68_9BACT|nr:HPr family phosphocarrier protein [Blastopirellula marina]
MAEDSIIRKVVIPNRQGLHARPANLFVKEALKHTCQVELERDGLKVSGKSILDVMTLAAEQGTELSIIVTGSDAEMVADALVDVVNRFVEEDEAENEG